MWPGVLTVSRTDFKPNATAVVYAHKALVNKFISSLQDEAKRRKENPGQEANPTEESKQ